MMDVVKKNVVNIICGVVALVALVSLVWPISGWYTELHDELAARDKVGKDVDGLLNQQPMYPNLTDGAPARPLGRFATRDAIEAGNDFMKGEQAKARELKQEVTRINREGHHLLAAQALPKPVETSQFYFQEQYQAVTRSGGKPGSNIGRNTPTGPVPENIPDGLLRATAAPTQQEIKEALLARWNTIFKPQISTTEKDGVVTELPQSRQDILARFERDAEKYVQDFRRDRTTKFKTYLDPDALTVAPNMVSGGRPPAPEEMWYAQMVVWVQQDIARAIRDMNTPRDNAGKEIVTEGIGQSRVKHLKKIEMGVGLDMYYTAASAAGPNAPAPPDGAPAGDTGKVYTRSVTGRVCNATHDVVHSKVTVVVDAGSVYDFIRMIESGRMITVLEVDQARVDNKEAAGAGYEYGSGQVVQLTLHLEHLFLRSWTAYGPTAPMPEDVQKKLGVVQPPPEAPAAGGSVAVSQ